MSTATVTRSAWAGITLLLALLLSAGAAGAGEERKLIVYGDRSLPPYEFIQDGIPQGAMVDLVHALAGRMHRTPEIVLKKWSDSQEAVLSGAGHALSIMGRTEEREAKYDFSEETFRITYSLFVLAEARETYENRNLTGLRIGVTQGGLPQTFLRENHPEVTLVVVENNADGVRRVLRREIDALAANTWSGKHFLSELNISGIAIATPPLFTHPSAMAIPKGNPQLVSEINAALRELKQDGTFDRIIDNWSSKKVYVLSEYEMSRARWLAGAGALLLVVTGAFVWIFRQQRNVLASEVAERRRAEAALDRLNADLERQVNERTVQLAQTQKLEAIGRLTGGVAHDFNNVLQGLSCCLSVVDRYVPAGPPRTVLESAKRSIDSGARLTQAMLAFARRQTLVPEPVDLRQMFDDIRPLLERTLGGLIGVTFDVQAGTPAALVDRSQLESAVLNLAINARDAMPSGGSLTLRAGKVIVRREEGGHSTELEPGTYVAVSVEDNGTGMDSQTQSRAFEPFFTTKALGKGTGLGLSMVHGMAAQSGGAVTIDSELGVGTKVTLYLPSAAAAVLEPARPEVASKRGDGSTVLLVDDNDMVRSALGVSLEALGYCVLEANGGAAALEVLQNAEEVDVLVTDYAMPGMTGAELVRLARHEIPDLPVLMITGYSERPEEIENMPVLQKPFDAGELAAILAALLASRPRSNKPDDDRYPAIGETSRKIVEAD